MTLTLRSVGQRLLLIPCAAALVTIGCGEGQILQSPTGPSGTLGSSAFQTVDDADIAATASSAGEFETLARGGNGKGNGNGGGNDKDKGGKKPGGSEDGEGSDNGGGPGRSHEDRVVGFVSAKFADAITVNGTNIYAGIDTVIRHGNRMLEMADIAIGDHVQARGTIEETKFVAIEIKVQDTGNDNEEGDGEVPPAPALQGAISGLSPIATCPVVTFMIGLQKVTTSAATVFDDVTCATLTNGALVKVEGTPLADGSIQATKVELQSGPDEVLGTVFELTGTESCATLTPALTFKVGATALTGTTVKTTATTTFTGVTCATLADGANVEVEGTTQADGSITAASVELH
jgi:hypothetical protein